MFKYLMYKLGQFLVKRLPSKAAYRLGVFLSDFQYYFSPRDRRAVRKNLRNILPDNDNLALLSREVFRNFGRYLVEFFRMKFMLDQQYIKEKVQVKNIERIQHVLDQGKGGIVLTAHIGNWELGAALVCQLGYPLMVIALPHKERPVNDLFNHQREIQGITVISTHNAVRTCYKRLKNNGLIALAADRDFSQNGEVLDFLGRKALIPKGAALFSQKTGAAVIPTFLTRDEENNLTLSICEPLYPPSPKSGRDEREVMLDMMRQYTSVIEEQIKEHPTQWLMFREFWQK